MDFHKNFIVFHFLDLSL